MVTDFMLFLFFSSEGSELDFFLSIVNKAALNGS